MTTSAALGPGWIAHRYDPGHDAVHFLAVERALRVRAPFLTDDDLKVERPPVVVRRAEAVRTASAGGRMNFIFHSAYCCSTLLANAYDRPGRVFSLKEPVILNDLVGWRHRGADPARLSGVLGDALALLSRPFEATEVGVIKPSNVVNALAPAVIAARPESGAVLLYAPLDRYLASIAGKGLWGRRWVRELLAKQLRDGIVDLGFSTEDIFLQTDLQVATVGWLAQHALFARIAGTWPDRVRTLNSDQLLARPADALAAIDRLFGVADDDAGRAAVVASVFSRNAKHGGAFDASSRQADQRDFHAAHGDEIDKVAIWARAVAEAAGVAFDLPSALL